MTTSILKLARAVVLAGAVVGGTGGLAEAFTWETLDYPDADWTFPTGIDNAMIVGGYSLSGYVHGFLVGDETWMTLDYPGALHTWLSGIYEERIVGSFQSDTDQKGFLYDNAGWTMLDYPGAQTTTPQGIDGANIVGSYEVNAGIYHGFWYDGVAWQTLDFPGASATWASDIDGDKVVGGYHLNDDYHGFVYNLTSGIWSTLDCPFRPGTTRVTGIDGNYIIGTYDKGFSDDNGFLFDGLNWKQVTYPHSGATIPSGIDGDTIVGVGLLDGNTVGFVATIPEPTCLAIVGSVVIGALVVNRHRIDGLSVLRG